MSEHSEAVKNVSRVLRNRADRAKNAGKHELALELDTHAAALEAAMAELVRLAKLTTALPQDLGNLHDLPQELLGELSVSKTDELEDQLFAVINSYGGQASLDQILVGLFRKFDVVQKRRFTQNKLYRMTKANVLWSVGGKKGVYSTTEPDEPQTTISEAEEAFNDDANEIPF